MKRLRIICEGETEQAFCMNVLYPYFISINIELFASRIKHSNGGIVKWTILKREIENHLKSSPNEFVSTLFDYYGLKTIHDFPKWNFAQKMPDSSLRMDCLENGMKLDITESLSARFIPYIQLHEFEGLLFTNIDVFLNSFNTNEILIPELNNVFKQFSNPEMINSNPSTSPSSRLKKIISGYNKVIYGSLLAEAIGLENIRQKAPRFNNWVEKLTNI